MAARREPPFRCPICHADRFVPVQVRRPDGNWYRTEFHECVGCSVMFTDPVKFAGNLVAGDGKDRAPRRFGLD